MTPDVWPFDPDEAAELGWKSPPLIDDGEWSTGEALSAHDPTTGEVIDDAPAIVGEVVESVDHTLDAALVVADGVSNASAMTVDLLRSPELLTAMSTELRARLRAMLDLRHDELRAQRRPGRVVGATVQPELAFLADAHEGLSALGSALTATALQARDMAGEVIVDLEPERKVGSSSVKVGTPTGELKVTRTQPSKVSVEDDKVVDVLVAYLVAQTSGDNDHAAYAAGAREALRQYRALVGPPAWKSTALDTLARQIEAAGEDGLAIRLGHAYGRVAHGKPSVNLERKPIETPDPRDPRYFPNPRSETP